MNWTDHSYDTGHHPPIHATAFIRRRCVTPGVTTQDIAHNLAVKTMAAHDSRATEKQAASLWANVFHMINGKQSHTGLIFSLFLN